MNATGHMVVARIAWDTMTPAARREVLDLVQVSDNPTSHKPTGPRDSDQFTAATYMDNIRPTYGNLHYHNLSMDGRNQPMERPADTPNSVTFIQQNIDILRDPGTSREEKAEALRYTMHLAGDLHQPLHCVNRFTPAHPDGDRGGNQFDIQWQGHMKESNLHAYWDDAAGAFAFIQRPLDAHGRQDLDAMAGRIEKSYPLTRYEVKARDVEPEHWAAEGFALAASDCYTGIKEHGAPSSAYEKKTIADMEREAAVAGYRLGNLLNSIFK